MAPDPQRLEFLMFVNCHVAAGNGTWVLLEEQPGALNLGAVSPAPVLSHEQRTLPSQGKQEGPMLSYMTDSVLPGSADAVAMGTDSMTSQCVARAWTLPMSAHWLWILGLVL